MDTARQEVSRKQLYTLHGRSLSVEEECRTRAYPANALYNRRNILHRTSVRSAVQLIQLESSLDSLP